MSDSHSKKTIAVFFGGRSAEHDVSIITAHIPIINTLTALGEYQIVPVYISKDGRWYSEPAMNSLAYFQDPDYEKKLASLTPLHLSFADGLTLQVPGWRGASYHIDIAFPAMHGTYGEDGSLMGVLRMANVPFVGCDLIASAVAMDKVLTKQVLAAEGIPVLPHVWFTTHDWHTNRQSLLEKMTGLSYPLFVKPVHLGSSIAITKAENESELLDAIELALHYDEKVLVEEAVTDLTEVTLPILGNDVLQCASIEQPLNKSAFFNFEDKYIGGGKKNGGGLNNQYSNIPAKISDELAATVTASATRTYRTLGCSGTARIDLLIDNSTGQVYVNEVNTLPGSLYDHNWKQSGVSNAELVTRLIALAEERHAERSKKTFVFTSGILQELGGGKLGGTQES